MSEIFDTLDYTNLIQKELVTKSFFSTELKSLEINLIKWIIGISFSQAALLLGIISFVANHK